MANIPPTSVSLIRTLSKDPQSSRWEEVYQKYAEPMRGFVRTVYPSLTADADDLIQLTMMALRERLPNYHYTPDSKKHFRNYLMGILKHKAADLNEARKRTEEAKKGIRRLTRPTASQLEEEARRRDALEVAIEQLLADDSINPSHRTIFRHLIAMREPPQIVADKFGIERDNVDQIKKRMTQRLVGLVDALLKDW